MPLRIDPLPATARHIFGFHGPLVDRPLPGRDAPGQNPAILSSPARGQPRTSLEHLVSTNAFTLFDSNLGVTSRRGRALLTFLAKIAGPYLKQMILTAQPEDLLDFSARYDVKVEFASGRDHNERAPQSSAE